MRSVSRHSHPSGVVDFARPGGGYRSHDAHAVGVNWVRLRDRTEFPRLEQSRRDVVPPDRGLSKVGLRVK